MRLASIALAALMASTAANAAYAQAESFFQKRYCTMGGGNRSSGMADCSYNTWEQCRQSTYGSKYCSENPNWKPQATPRGRRTGQE